ncbi:efflux RND transporter periplasmic adaptor subunit [Sphingomonas flavalba]|uniref:efflux RND transporter periplasmic adaptor subunit n=1 Tax=Sphingomonas flavalba TaxID=2559804 RepID=UPI0039DF2C2B
MMASAAEPQTNLDDFLGTPAPAPWKRWLKWIVGGGILLLVLLLVWRFGGETKTEYATQEAQKGNLAVTVSATGKLQPENQVDVGAQLSGQVIKVYVDVNDRVTAGQRLAEIDPATFNDAIVRSQAALSAAQATVAQNQASVAEAKAQLARLEEVSRLSGGRVPAKTEMATQQATVQRALANLRAAEANVVSARAQVSSDTTQRRRATIVSPVSGVVLARQIEPGQTVASSFNTPTLFVIAQDLTSMKLQVAIDEADVGQVKAEQEATFTVDAYPGRSFPAKITRVDVGANNSATSSSSTTTTSSSSASSVVAYNAILRVANPDEALRPGMTATADIAVQKRENVLLVPNAALRFSPEQATRGQQGGQSSLVKSITPGPRARRSGGNSREVTIGAGSRRTLYVVGADGKPQAVEVVVGATDGSRTEVTGGGLKPGSKVIVGQRARTDG